MELRRNPCGSATKLTRVQLSVALLAPLFTACEPTPTASDVAYDGPPASLIFFNGIVLTMDPTEGGAQAVALHRGLGDADRVRRAAAGAGRPIDSAR